LFELIGRGSRRLHYRRHINRSFLRRSDFAQSGGAVCEVLFRRFSGLRRAANFCRKTPGNKRNVTSSDLPTSFRCWSAGPRVPSSRAHPTESCPKKKKKSAVIFASSELSVRHYSLSHSNNAPVNIRRRTKAHHQCASQTTSAKVSSESAFDAAPALNHRTMSRAASRFSVYSACDGARSLPCWTNFPVARIHGAAAVQ